MNKRQNIKKRSFFASKNKLIKAMGGTALAVLISVGAILGLMPLSTNISAAQNAATSGPQGAQNAAGTADSGLNTTSNTFNLNPETDPVIFTTQSGLEIRSHELAGSTFENSNLQYFTLGTYNGTALKWIILATSPTMNEITTPAGTAINADASKQTISMMTTTDLSENQILAISEKVIPVSSYTFSVTLVTSTQTHTLPGSASGSNAGVGWPYGTSGGSNAWYYATSLLNEPSDYYSSYPEYTHSSTINDWFTGSTLGLSSYCGKGIVKNSNFSSSCYGFALTTTHISQYLPTNLYAANDTSGTARDYWCGNDVTFSCDYSGVSSTSSSKHYYCTGSGLCKSNARYINTSGVISSDLAVAKGTLSHTESNRYCTNVGSLAYIDFHTATYSIVSGSTSFTAYYRPAMVIDISKF